MAWFSALKLGLNAATHIYKKRQETKMAMADAQHMHAAKMARGEEQYQGKLLEARQADWKDEFVLLVLSAPIAVLAWAVISEDPTAMDKVKLFSQPILGVPPPTNATPIDVPLTCTACAPVTSSSLPTCSVPSRLIR